MNQEVTKEALKMTGNYADKSSVATYSTLKKDLKSCGISPGSYKIGDANSFLFDAESLNTFAIEWMEAHLTI